MYRLRIIHKLFSYSVTSCRMYSDVFFFTHDVGYLCVQSFFLVNRTRGWSITGLGVWHNYIHAGFTANLTWRCWEGPWNKWWLSFPCHSLASTPHCLNPTRNQWLKMWSLGSFPDWRQEEKVALKKQIQENRQGIFWNNDDYLIIWWLDERRLIMCVFLYLVSYTF